MSTGCCHVQAPAFDGLSDDYRRRLIAVIVINAVMFVVEMTAGQLSRSQALQADALDFFADSVTYGASLAVIGMALRTRSLVALAKGASLAVIGLWVFGSTVYRVFVVGVPSAEIMGIIGFLALAANLASVLILIGHKEGDAFYTLLQEHAVNSKNHGYRLATSGTKLPEHAALSQAFTCCEDMLGKGLLATLRELLDAAPSICGQTLTARAARQYQHHVRVEYELGMQHLCKDKKKRSALHIACSTASIALAVEAARSHGVQIQKEDVTFRVGGQNYTVKSGGAASLTWGSAVADRYVLADAPNTYLDLQPELLLYASSIASSHRTAPHRTAPHCACTVSHQVRWQTDRRAGGGRAHAGRAQPVRAGAGGRGHARDGGHGCVRLNHPRFVVRRGRSRMRQESVARRAAHALACARQGARARGRQPAPHGLQIAVQAAGDVRRAVRDGHQTHHHEGVGGSGGDRQQGIA